MNRIKQFRDAKGWSLADLAEHAGTSPQQVERLEKGHRRLTVDWMVRLGRALGVEPGLLSEELRQLDGPAFEVWAAIQSLSDENKPRALRLVLTLAAEAPAPPGPTTAPPLKRFA